MRTASRSPAAQAEATLQQEFDFIVTVPASLDGGDISS